MEHNQQFGILLPYFMFHKELYLTLFTFDVYCILFQGDEPYDDLTNMTQVRAFVESGRRLDQPELCPPQL